MVDWLNHRPGSYRHEPYIQNCLILHFIPHIFLAFREHTNRREGRKVKKIALYLSIFRHYPNSLGAINNLKLYYIKILIINSLKSTQARPIA
jgi:hypothetical protein